MVGSLHVWYNAPRFGITESQISRFFYSFRTQRYFTLSDAWWRQSNFLNGLLVIMPPWPQCTARWATVQPFGVKYSEDAVCQQLSQSTRVIPGTKTVYFSWDIQRISAYNNYHNNKLQTGAEENSGDYNVPKNNCGVHYKNQSVLSTNHRCIRDRACVFPGRRV